MKSVKAKIGLLTSGVALTIAILLLVAFYFSFKSMVTANVSQLDASLREGFDRTIRWEVETANSMLLRLDALATEGKLDRAEAAELAKTLLRELRYGPEGYFWADTVDGTNVVLLGKDAEGKNRMDSLDANKYPFIKNLIANGLKDGGGIPTIGSRRPERTSLCRRGVTPCSRNPGDGCSAPGPTSTIST